MRLIAIFATVSALAVALGAVVCTLSGVPTAVWIRNPAVWLVGALMAAGLAVGTPRIRLPVVLLAAPAALAVTFLGEGLSGVHRWLEAGPLRLNAAMLVLPMLAVAVACTEGVWRWVAALACLVLLVVQPDASQATALAAVVALVALRSPEPAPAKALIVAAATGLATLAWLRPDPLEPVPEVEGILTLAAQTSPLLAAASLAALAAAALTPAFALRHATPDLRLAAAALAVCLAVWTLAPFLGAFPVPILGVGPSPMVGAWLGMGVLAGVVTGSRLV